MNHVSELQCELERVRNADARKYLTEALECYHIGAFRACIVMTANAVFADLFDRVTDYASYDGAAKTLKDRLDDDMKQQKAFEAHMVETLHGANFITFEQKTFLMAIRESRNRAAHPSGIRAGAEEARYIFTQAVTNFLERPWLSAAEGAARLSHEMQLRPIFPDRGQDADVVSERLSEIAPVAHRKLMSDLWSELRAPTTQVMSRNAERFLVAMSGLRRESYRKGFVELLDRGSGKHRQNGIVEQGDDVWRCHAEDWLLRIIAADINILVALSGSKQALLDERIAAICRGEANQSSETAVEDLIEAMCRSEARSEVVGKYPDTLVAAVDRIGDRIVLLGALEASDQLRTLAAARIHDVWDNGLTAVRLAQTLPDLDEAIARGFQDSDVFDVIVALSSFERQMNDATLSDLVWNGFKDLRTMRRVALVFAAADPDAAAESLEHHHLCGLPAFIKFLTPKPVVNPFHRRALV